MDVGRRLTGANGSGAADHNRAGRLRGVRSHEHGANAEPVRRTVVAQRVVDR